jgi:hypothetical protein
MLIRENNADYAGNNILYFVGKHCLPSPCEMGETSDKELPESSWSMRFR